MSSEFFSIFPPSFLKKKKKGKKKILQKLQVLLIKTKEKEFLKNLEKARQLLQEIQIQNLVQKQVVEVSKKEIVQPQFKKLSQRKKKLKTKLKKLQNVFKAKKEENLKQQNIEEINVIHTVKERKMSYKLKKREAKQSKLQSL